MTKFTENQLTRFWSGVRRGASSDCWPWMRSRTTVGYGQFGITGPPRRNLPAHRIAYELLVGPVPDGLVLDHLCRNRVCCNPHHLEPVTNRTNVVERGTGISAVNALKTHCKHGHEFTPDNTRIVRDKDGPYRACLECKREHKRKENLRNRRARKVA